MSMRAPFFPIEFTALRVPTRPTGLMAFAHQTPVKVALALFVGMMLGLSTTAWLLEHKIDIAARKIGPWTIWPKSGTPEIDPYARAIYAQSGQIALASAEGVLLSAATDDDGTPLTGKCSYRIAGELPPARFWTLGATTAAGTPIDNPAGRYAFTSAEVLRRTNGSFVIDAASSVRPGNWLPLSGEDRFSLLLRLYDAPSVSTLAGPASSAVPSIRKEACQ